MPAQSPVIITYAEAGKMLLGISERTVRRMVSNGDLPYVKVRGRVGVPYDAVLEYVQRQTQFAESKQKGKQCLTVDQIAHTGGSHTPPTQANRLAEVVRQQTSRKQKP